MTSRRWLTLGLAAAACCGAAQAANLDVPLRMATEDGAGAAIGSVRIEQTAYGLAFTPALHGLTPGLHGFHVHAEGSCAPSRQDGKVVPAGAAGGHLDPTNSGRHGLPWGDGHLGDLPAIYVDTDGRARQPVLAPRLKLDDVRGRALMVHVGGDNHADHPMPLGGGGARMACGVIAQDVQR